MKYLSVCSGIEAATQAWHGLGWKPVGFSEIEPFPAAVLAHHYPETTNFGDMTKFKGWNLAESVDLLVGGTPCQSFSIAGLRKGLDDPRGNLMLTYLAIAAKHKPKWVVWENVPGVLSSNRGRDFAAFLRGLEEFGYGWAYRVLDSQYFGVAQRRRRVFVVGHFGNWQRAAAVLFERNSLCGNPAPSRTERKDVAGPITAGINKGCRGTEGIESNWAVPVSYGIPGNWIGRKSENGDNAVEPMHDVAPCLTKTDRHGVAQPIAFHVDAMPDQMNFSNETTASLTCSQHAGVAQPIAWSEELTPSIDVAGTIQYGGQGGRRDGVMQTNMAVRRLTPVECERLQGFPDNYTNIPWRNKPESSDGPRYKALGNSMAVPVMRWIGERIAEVEKIA